MSGSRTVDVMKVFAEDKDYASKVKELNKRKNSEIEAVEEKYKSLLCEYDAEKEKVDKLNADFNNEWREKLADYNKEIKEHNKKVTTLQKSKLLTVDEVNELNNVFEQIAEKHKDVLCVYKKAKADFSPQIDDFDNKWEPRLLDYRNEVKSIESKFRKEKKVITAAHKINKSNLIYGNKAED